jgi:hypothetical protein
MGILKQRSNKKFSYNPRFYKSDKEGSPYQIERKFDKYRKATSDNKGLKKKFTNAWDDFKNNPNRRANRIILIVIAVLILLFLFIIDFDLSIFYQFP